MLIDPSKQRTLLLDLAARVSRDGVMPDGSVGPVGGSVILSAEDGDEDTIKPRLVAAGVRQRRTPGANEPLWESKLGRPRYLP